jgi:hypothetical protein
MTFSMTLTIDRVVALTPHFVRAACILAMTGVRFKNWSGCPTSLEVGWVGAKKGRLPVAPTAR